MICKKFSEKLEQFPLLTSWYQRIQEVPKVKTAAFKCGICFLDLPELLTPESKEPVNSSDTASVDEQSDPLFVGGPRPTMTKLMEKGIEAMFSPHPCPAWTLDWSSLPAAVSPKEGELCFASWCKLCVPSGYSLQSHLPRLAMSHWRI
eukprot:XP_017446836.1 PREDICTED: glutathione S-transferase C-terminal domain-containing protein-like [Rattus norvegicus]